MVCDGPVRGVGQFVWMNSAWNNATNFGLYSFLGYQTAPWSYMSVAHAAQALTYAGMSYLAASNISIGDSQALPNITTLVTSALSFTGANAARTVTFIQNENSTDQYDYTVPVGDADPVQLAAQFLTQPEWGVPDFPANAIDTVSWYATAAALGGAGDSSWQAWCYANGISLSLVLSSVEEAASVLERVFRLTVTAPVWSGGVLKAIPYGDSAVSGNQYSFTPNLAPVYALTPDDLIVDKGSDGITIDRKDVSSAHDVPNCIRLEWRNSANLFNAEPMEAKDQGQIEIYGLHVAPTIDAKEITYAPVAQTVASLLLNRGLYIRNSFKLRLPGSFYLLDPMDLVTLTLPDLGLNAVVVRITQVTADDKGVLEIEAEEFPQGVAGAVLYPVQTIQPAPVNTNQPPDPVNPPVIFEPTIQLTGGVPAVWLAVSGGAGGVADANWGGAEIWASLDNATYQLIGQVDQPARMGVSTATLAAFAGTNPDNADTLTVSLAESNGALTGTGAAAAAQAQTLCWLGGELLSFTTATLGSGTVPAVEPDAVPANAPYAVTVSQQANWVSDSGVTCGLGPVAGAMFNAWPVDMGSVAVPAAATDDFGGLTDTPVTVINLGLVTDATGVPGSGTALGVYAKVSGVPGAGQYAVSNGVYSFNAANAGDLVQISYGFSGTVYALTGLYRGLYGTTATSHAAGTAFARLDARIFKYPLPTAFINQTIWLKFASFNIWGNALQDLSTVDPYTYVPAGTGWLGPVATMMAQGVWFDMGLVTQAVTVQDNFGLVTDPYNYPIDLGSIAA
jgi:hypothetical protein